MNYHLGKDVLIGVGIGVIAVPALLLSTNMSSLQSFTGAQSTVAGAIEYNERYTPADTSTIQEVYEVKPQIVQAPTRQKVEIQTQAQTIEPLPVQSVLNVPYHEQIYTLSCESASLQMALQFKGVTMTQDEIIALLPRDGGPRITERADGSLEWGDPDKGFVGAIDGFFWNKKDGLRGATGWGVNNEPVARLGNSLYQGVRAETGMSTEQLKRELADENPVIFWHVRDDASRKETVNYTTAAGKPVAFFQNHVALITGYKTIGGVVVYTIQDPEYGTYEIDEANLERIWSKYNRDAVVVGS